MVLYEVWSCGRQVLAWFGEDALRAYLLHVGIEHPFTVYNDSGYDVTQSFPC